MNNIKNIVFGSSGTIGKELSKKLNYKNTLFISRTKPKNSKINNWKKVDLDKKFIKFPKKVDKIFFLASPYYTIKNFNKKIFYKEYKWLKNIVKNIKTIHFIYLSSSSVYLQKHPLGEIKILCEKFLLKKKINYLQIWRPFNIIGQPNRDNLSDHFHNLLIKNFIKKKNKKYEFNGSENDERGYSSSIKFAKVINNFSKKKVSFVYNYGNPNTVTVREITRIFEKIFIKKYKKKIKISFKKIKGNANTINKKMRIKTFKTNENSKNILKRYFLEINK